MTTTPLLESNKKIDQFDFDDNLGSPHDMGILIGSPQITADMCHKILRYDYPYQIANACWLSMVKSVVFFVKSLFFLG